MTVADRLIVLRYNQIALEEEIDRFGRYTLTTKKDLDPIKEKIKNIEEQINCLCKEISTPNENNKALGDGLADALEICYSVNNKLQAASSKSEWTFYRVFQYFSSFFVTYIPEDLQIQKEGIEKRVKDLFKAPSAAEIKFDKENIIFSDLTGDLTFKLTHEYSTVKAIEKTFIQNIQTEEEIPLNLENPTGDTGEVAKAIDATYKKILQEYDSPLATKEVKQEVASLLCVLKGKQGYYLEQNNTDKEKVLLVCCERGSEGTLKLKKHVLDLEKIPGKIVVDNKECDSLKEVLEKNDMKSAVKLVEIREEIENQSREDFSVDALDESNFCPTLASTIEMDKIVAEKLSTAGANVGIWFTRLPSKKTWVNAMPGSALLPQNWKERKGSLPVLTFAHCQLLNGKEAVVTRDIEIICNEQGQILDPIDSSGEAVCKNFNEFREKAEIHFREQIGLRILSKMVSLKDVDNFVKNENFRNQEVIEEKVLTPKFDEAFSLIKTTVSRPNWLDEGLHLVSENDKIGLGKNILKGMNNLAEYDQYKSAGQLHKLLLIGLCSFDDLMWAPTDELDKLTPLDLLYMIDLVRLNINKIVPFELFPGEKKDGLEEFLISKYFAKSFSWDPLNPTKEQMDAEGFIKTAYLQAGDSSPIKKLYKDLMDKILIGS